VRRLLTDLIEIEQGRYRARPTPRSAAILTELARLKSKSIRWLELEPLRAATALPPPSFASLQLLTAAGYREAYRACMTLSLGLRLEGGPLQLSVKDLNLLYEYWCYLALLRITAEETGAQVDPRRIFAVRDRGLSVLLCRGNESSMPFALPDGRRLTVRYNPKMGKDALVPQQPDLLLTMEHRDWPAVHLVLDAKYRLDDSDEYVARYASRGPPEDALNAMHRYRDAILEQMDGATTRTVVQAAALFPDRVEPVRFVMGRLWRALRRIGVGAIPLLPGHEQLLRDWLRQWLNHGGWNMADHAIDHAAIRRASEWRRAAAEPVLIGSLRGEDPRRHLQWIRETRQYYTPLAKNQPRLFAAATVVFYEPSRAIEKGHAGVVRLCANVLNARVIRRGEIATPWTPGRSIDEEQVLYDLSSVTELPRAIPNWDAQGRGSRMGVRRWSSRLALRRARTLPELFLETEPEWRLYEELLARNVRFELRVQRPRLRSEDDLMGRVHFVFGDLRELRWAGAAGFVIRDREGRELSAGSAPAVFDALGVLSPSTTE